ncbi:MAG: D-alanyl-D-alanine carboxypeptidase/D-alanyl-D-alanine-endopeptidase [Planctomycetes bacterium]|nr:D-alanyl-D-alanine carboxypeptidase/D-alanyl-D-alanine-endopeptidase [Planctomycetota bacterium]
MNGQWIKIRMNRVSHVALAALVAQAVLVTFAAGQSALERELRSALSALPHTETRVSACVVNLRFGETILAYHADKSLTPASSMKLFTMVTALALLGPGFEFETVLATDGTNLIAIGDGDPSTGDRKLLRSRGESITAELERWADVLAVRGVTTIPGDLVIDESIFDAQFVHPSWEQSDLDNWYAAPIGALNFNDNCIDITITPAARAGDPVLVSFVPKNSLVEIVNKCVSGGKGDPVLRHPHDSFSYRISGHCRKRWAFGPVSFPDPGKLFADSLRTVLQDKGITIAGDVVRRRVRRADGSLPKDLTIVAKSATSLSDVLARVGRNSQNMFAECVFKRTGYAWALQTGQVDPRGSWQTGREAVLHVAHRAGLEPAGLAVADGSGLSRDNACTARQLVTLLAWVDRQAFGPILLNNLAIGGEAGSLRKRLAELGPRVRAKTGTMRGITALAGYVGDAGEAGGTGLPAGLPGRYAFAVLFNGYPGTSAPYKAIQDRICRALARAVEPATPRSNPARANP